MLFIHSMFPLVASPQKEALTLKWQPKVDASKHQKAKQPNFPLPQDGQRLVPYQCVVARQEWEAAKDRFVNAFLLQKKAYRRANGGSSAPSFHVDAPGAEPFLKRLVFFRVITLPPTNMAPVGRYLED